MTKASTQPRVGRGGGPLPTHVSDIFHELDGGYRLQIHQRGTLRSRLGFHRELRCTNQAEFDAQMDFLIAARVPCMVGQMMSGASDAAYFWLQGQGRRIDYLESSYGGKTEWSVREIFEGAKAWWGVKLDELLGSEIDLFDPANCLRPATSEPLSASPASPAEPAETAETEQTPTPGVTPPPERVEATVSEAAPVGLAPPVVLPTKTPKSPGRTVATMSAGLPVVWLGGAIWRATGYFQYEMPFYLADVLTLASLAGLAGGTATLHCGSRCCRAFSRAARTALNSSFSRCYWA